MATVTITAAGTYASAAFSTVTLTKAGVEAATSSVVTLTEAGVVGAAAGALVNIVKASWLGDTVGASVNLTSAAVIADTTQGPAPEDALRFLRVNNLWRPVNGRKLRVNGAWVNATGTPTPPATFASVAITQGRVFGQLNVTPPPTGWNPNTGPMQRPDRGSDERVNGGQTPIVWYEDLYVTGDTVSQALARLVTPAVVAFPEGRFQQADFRQSGGPYSMVWPAKCLGVWGSGRGAVGSNVGTIFSMVPNSSTRASEVPPQNNSTPCPFKMVYHGGINGVASYGQFHLEGTEQGHIYHGLQVFGFNNDLIMQDVLTNGMYGNNGAPPGETFNIELHGNNAGANPTYLRVESDGRRAIGGPSYSAVGLDIANCQQGTMRDCYSHHTVASSVVLYESFNINTFNVKCGDPSDTDGTGIDGFNAGGRLNQERTAGCVHTDMQFHAVFKNRGKTVHVTHSNDTVTRGAFTTKDGTVKFINPKFNDIWGDNKFYIQSWHPYWTGCSMDGLNKTGIPAQSFAVNTDGSPLVAYKYVHDPGSGGFTTANGFANGQRWNSFVSPATTPGPPHPNV